MIKISKLNGKELVINCELIETIESLPDTTITMTNGKKKKKKRGERGIFTFDTKEI